MLLKFTARKIDKALEYHRYSVMPYEIGRDGQTTMKRWGLIPRNRWLNIYHHEIVGADRDTCHDHPWVSVSLLLSGSLRERIQRTPNFSSFRNYQPGALVFRRAKTAHRLEPETVCRTLFITGPIVRDWGFHCPQGWMHWKEFTDYEKTGDSSMGRGCGEKND